MAAMRYALVLLMLLALPAQAVELYRCTVKGKVPCTSQTTGIHRNTDEAKRKYI